MTALRDAMLPARGAPPSIEWRALADLAIDAAYQRSVEGKDSQSAIRRIALNWDWRLCGVLAVSRRNDEGRTEHFVIDGQHRLEGARLRGDIPFLPCIVNSFDDVEGEAECFVALNSKRRALKPVHLHRAAVAAGDADALDLARSLAAVGLTLSPSADWRAWPTDAVVNVGGIAKARRRHGAEITDRALRVFADAWRGTVRRGHGTIFAAILGVLVESGGGGVTDALLTELLAAQEVEGWHAEIRGEELATGDRASVAAVRVFARACAEALADD